MLCTVQPTLRYIYLQMMPNCLSTFLMVVIGSLCKKELINCTNGRKDCY